MLIVKKYGGSSVSTPEKISAIAQKLKSLHDEGHKLIVIISAMGDTTDDLVSLCRRITHTPVQRELDMLLSSGERISMALLAIALNDLGCPAISFTGSQSGVLTDASHNNARIIDIKPIRVKEEIAKGKVVIIAGFQGVNPQTKEVTTLGRGGSDTTAVAVAAHFNADECHILTDVRGVYSIDPRVPGTTPQAFQKLDYDSALELTYWGARVLHFRSVQLAARAEVPILVHLSSEVGSGTLITSMEETLIRAVNYNTQLATLRFDDTFGVREALEALSMGLQNGKLPWPQIIHQRKSNTGFEIFFAAPDEIFESIGQNVAKWCVQHQKAGPVLESQMASVTVTGQGLVGSSALFDASQVLSRHNIHQEALVTSAMSMTFIVPTTQVQLAAQVLHKEFVENSGRS